MKTGRANRAALIFASGMTNQLVMQLSAFFVTPLTLLYMGEDRIGAFRAMGAWFAYVALLDLGISGAFWSLSNRAIAAGQGAWEAAFSSVVLGYRKVAMRVVLGGLLLCVFIQYLVVVPTALRTEVLISCAILAINALFIVFTPLQLVLVVSQRGHIANFTNSIVALVVPLLTILYMYCGFGIPSFGMAILSGSILIWAIYLSVTIKNSPELLRLFFRPQPNLEASQELKQLSKPALLSRFSSEIGLQNETIIVSTLLDPAALVPLFISQRLISVVSGPLRSIGDSSWAGMAELYHRGNLTALKARFLDLCSLTFVLGCSLMLPIICYNDQFVSLWVGKEYDAGVWIVVLAAINLMMLGIGSHAGWLFTGAGKLSLTAPIGFYSALINLSVSLLATYFFGIIGPLIGNFAGFSCYQCATLSVLLKKHFSIGRREILTTGVKPVLLSISVLPFSWYLAHSYEHSWIALVSELGLWSGVLLGLNWKVALSSSQRELILRATKLDKLINRFGSKTSKVSVQPAD